MTSEKIENIFWLLFAGWLILRILLLGSQYIGNSDPVATAEILQFFTQEDIDAGREYSLRGFWFKTVYGTLFVVFLIFLLHSGFFSSVWNKCNAWFGEGLLRTDLVFILFFLLVVQLLSLPMSFYFGHFLEVEAGFANVNFAGWLLKYLKSAGLGLIFECTTIMLLLTVIRWFPVAWPVLLPAAMGGLGLFVTLLVPLVVTPLFYEQTPLAEGEFRDRLLEIATKADMSVKEIYVVDESRYSKHTNAYFTGVGPFRRIVLYDTLLKSHTPEEAALIFAHEAGHWKYNHVAWGLSLGVLGAFAAAVVYLLLFPWLSQVQWFGLPAIASARNIPFIIVITMLLQLYFAPVESQISQFMERQADRTAIELTGLNEVYRQAQIRLSRDNRSELLPHPLRVFWLYSHPPTIDRIKSAM